MTNKSGQKKNTKKKSYRTRVSLARPIIELND